MIEERSALPESIGELFDTAFAAYGKRVRFYLAIAVAAFLLQGAVVVASIALHLAPLTAERILLLVSVFVDAFVMGAVSIGIVADVSGAQIADTGTLFVTSLFRWPLLIAVFSLQSVIVIVTSVALFGGGVGTFLLFVLPVA